MKAITFWRLAWRGFNPFLRAAVVGLILGAGIIGILMGTTLTVFDWWKEWKRVLFAWPFVSALPGAAYYVRGPQIIDQIAKKL